MDLKDIVSISGKPGLYKILAQGKNNIFVESLAEKKRFPAYASDKISSLQDISIYTLDDDLKLTDVYELMFKNLDGNSALSHKENPKKLRDYLLTIIPTYDSERVYDSDVKKLFQWYNILQKLGLLLIKEEEVAQESKSTKPKSTKPKATKPKATKPKPKAKSKPNSSSKSSSKKTPASKKA